jgi:predicted dehydrogenase
MNQQAIRLGVAGLGGWGKNVVRSFGSAKRCELAMLCDSNPQALETHQKLFPHAATTQNFGAILDDETIDAVALATPAPLHYQMVKAALEAGKHVYVEKPMTLTVADAEDLVRIADETNRKLMVGHLLEYHPAIALIKDLIDREELGHIYYMYSQRINLGVVRKDENAFWSLAPHDVSVALYLFGQEPSEIVASGECYLQPGIEDVVFANLRFPDGRMAQIHVSWLDPNKYRKMIVVGSKKMVVFDDMEPNEKVRLFDKGATVRMDAVGAPQAIQVRHGDIHIPHVPADEPLNIEVQHFVDCILNDATPRSDGRDGLRVVRVLDRVHQILEQRRGSGMGDRGSGIGGSSRG